MEERNIDYYLMLEEMNNLFNKGRFMKGADKFPEEFEIIKKQKNYILEMNDFFDLTGFEEEGILYANILENLAKDINQDKEIENLINLLAEKDEKLLKLFIFEIGGTFIEELKELLSYFDDIKPVLHLPENEKFIDIVVNLELSYLDIEELQLIIEEEL